MKKLLLFFMLIACSTLSVSAQETHTISGKIIDSSNRPLSGVSIQAKPGKTGTISKLDGSFQLKIGSNITTLIFTYVGYAQQIVKIEPNKNQYEIVLKPSSIDNLKDVVVVGYGQQKRSDLTGSITSISAEDLNKGGTVSNVAQSLQGKSAGVVVSQNSGAPGGSLSIRVRGSNSINSSNEPLYVIDGFPTDNGSSINPNDIASIEILKDASATAIYGSRGANGVIIITTKRGKAGKNNISYNGYTGFQQIINPFHMLDGKQYMNLANALYAEIPGKEGSVNGVYTASQLKSDVNTDWVKAATQSGNVQSHNLQFSGGSENTKVLTSIGYFKQQGVLKNTSFDRISARANIDQKINEYVKAGISMFAQREKSNYQQYSGNILNSNVLYSILTYDPTVPLYNADGSFGRPPGGRGDNPVANLVARINDLQNDKFNANSYLEIKPIKGLTARVDAGAEILQGKTGNYLPKSTYQGSIDDGVASTSSASLTHSLFDAYITYNKTFTNEHAFTVMAGYSYEKFVNESAGVNVSGFSTDIFSYNNLGAASVIKGVRSYKSEHLLQSVFGRLNYSYLDRYLFTATVRRDGSSRFAEANRWGIFPSGAFAWKIAKENFFQNQHIFSDLKFRLSYGVTGNERIGNYASYGLVSNTHLTFDGINNTSGTFLNAGTPENDKLKWESTAQFDAGLDMGFLNNRITSTVDYYYKKTSDLLLAVGLPLYSGFSSELINIGDIQNQGVELNIHSDNLVNTLKWSTDFNISFNRNKVLSLGGQSDIRLKSAKPIGTVSENDFAIIREGLPLGTLFGYVYEGVIQAGETYAPQPNSVAGDPKFKDISGPNGVPDGKITADDETTLGNAYPKATLGLSNNLSYKNFSFSFSFYGSLGNKMLNMSRMNLEWNRTTDALNRWTPTNTNTDIPRNGFFYSPYGGYINSHFIEDASFVRLRNVTLGYDVPLNTKIISSLHIYATAENLLTITNYTGWNPEVNTKAYESGSQQTVNAGAGLDFNSYPSMRNFTFGVNIKF